MPGRHGADAGADNPHRDHSPDFVRTIHCEAGWISSQMERRRSRRALLEMTDDQLKDIGLSRGEAYSEFTRRLWD